VETIDLDHGKGTLAGFCESGNEPCCSSAITGNCLSS